MSNDQSEVKPKITKERSTSYPSIPINQAVEYSSKLQSGFRKATFSRDNAVKEMGFNTVTGTSGMRVSALVHYGLLNRDGGGYKNSDLSLRLAHPKDDNDTLVALQEAALKPKLFKTLAEKFNGGPIPSALNSILIRDHGITSKVANEVASVFRSTLEIAGLFTNGIVNLTPSEEDIQTPIITEKIEDKEIQSKKITHGLSDQTKSVVPVDTISVKMPSGIVITYPISMAYSFTIGLFGKEIAALEEAIQKEIQKGNN